MSTCVIGILFLLPVIPAVEIHTMEESQKAVLQQNIKGLDYLPKIRFLDVLKGILISFFDWWEYVKLEGGLVPYLFNLILWILHGAPIKY